MRRNHTADSLVPDFRPPGLSETEVPLFRGPCLPGCSAVAPGHSRTALARGGLSQLSPGPRVVVRFPSPPPSAHLPSSLHKSAHFQQSLFLVNTEKHLKIVGSGGDLHIHPFRKCRHQPKITQPGSMASRCGGLSAACRAGRRPSGGVSRDD